MRVRQAVSAALFPKSTRKSFSSLADTGICTLMGSGATNSMSTLSPFNETGVPSRRTTGTDCTTAFSSEIPISGSGCVGLSLKRLSMTVVSSGGSDSSDAAMASGVKSPFRCASIMIPLC